eukprot:UN26992
MIGHSMIWCILFALVNGVQVMPISHHQKASPTDKEIYQIQTDGKIEWYHAGEAPKWSGTPPPLYDERWKDPSSTILIQIAALRETRCGETIFNFLTNAKFPERILFVVIQQNAPEDSDCMEQMCQKFDKPITKNEDGTFDKKDCPYFDQVTIQRLTNRQAKGPMYARGLANQHVDESKHDFCLQVDAHETGVQDWDVKLLRQWAMIDNEFAVITTYPTTPNNLNEKRQLRPRIFAKV